MTPGFEHQSTASHDGGERGPGSNSVAILPGRPDSPRGGVSPSVPRSVACCWANVTPASTVANRTAASRRMDLRTVCIIEDLSQAARQPVRAGTSSRLSVDRAALARRMDGAIWFWTDARRRSTNAQHRASGSWLQPASGLSIRPRPGSWKLFTTVVRFDVLNDLPDDAAGIAGGEHPLGLVAGHDAAGADDRARADPHTWADDRPATDPDVRADLYWFAVLDTASQFRVHRVQGRIDLHGRSEHGETADPHFADVEHDAVVVEVDRLPEADIEPMIAE